MVVHFVPRFEAQNPNVSRSNHRKMRFGNFVACWVLLESWYSFGVILYFANYLVPSHLGALLITFEWFFQERVVISSFSGGFCCFSCLFFV